MRAKVAAAALSLQVLTVADLLREVLEQHAIAFAVLKGPVLADHYWPPDDRTRTYADLDVLVAPRDVARTLDLLRQDFDGHVVEALPGEREQPVGIRGGVTVDLHWDLCQSDELARGFSVDVDAVLSRRVLRKLHDTDCWCPDDLDMLLHVAQHAVTAGALSERAWKDVDAVVRTAEPDWAELVARARESRQHLVAAVALRRTRDALQTPVPESAIRALEGRALWPRLVRATTRSSRAAPWVAGTTRGSDRESARAFAVFLRDSARRAPR